MSFEPKVGMYCSTRNGLRVGPIIEKPHKHENGTTMLYGVQGMSTRWFNTGHVWGATERSDLDLVGAWVEPVVSPPIVDAKILDTPPMWIGYTNYRGEYAIREIIPLRVDYKVSEWHGEEPQHILSAWDVEKAAERDFLLVDMIPGIFLRGEKMHQHALHVVDQYLCWCDEDESQWDAIGESEEGSSNANRRRKMASFIHQALINAGMKVVPEWTENVRMLLETFEPKVGAPFDPVSVFVASVLKPAADEIIKDATDKLLSTVMSVQVTGDLTEDQVARFIKDQPRPFLAPAELKLSDATSARFQELLEANNALLERARAAEESLYLMREFAIRNATVWEAGSGHHHPIWEHVAEVLHENWHTVDINAAKRYAFIHPNNQETLEALRNS